MLDKGVDCFDNKADPIGFHRDKVQQVMSAVLESGKPELLIHNHLVQLRHAGDLLEWESLLPPFPELPFPSVPVRSNPNDRESGTDSLFQEKMWELLESATITASEFNRAKMVMETFRIVLAAAMKACGDKRTPQVHMFRNWYLQFKNSTSDSLLLIAHASEGLKTLNCECIIHIREFCIWFNRQFSIFYISDDSPQSKVTSFHPEWITAVIHYCEEIYGLPTPADDVEPSTLSFTDMDRVGLDVLDIQLNLKFRLVTAPCFLPEMQRCRLLQYYCQFDPRIKPLLGVVHLWAVTNKIHIGRKDIDSQQAHRHVPDPSALEWLVVMFLLDKKIIPTPREIQKLPHQPLNIVCRYDKEVCNNDFDDRRVIDIGFSADPQFAVEWAARNSKRLEQDGDTVAAMKSVFELAAGFFNYVSHHCGHKNRCLVLNTRDGEVLKKSKIFALNQKEESQLTSEEMFYLREELGKETYKSSRILLMNPFYIKWRFSISDNLFLHKVVPKMWNARSKLQSFAEKLGSSDGEEIEIKSIDLEDVLKYTPTPAEVTKQKKKQKMLKAKLRKEKRKAVKANKKAAKKR